MYPRVCMFLCYVTPALPQMTQLRMRFCTTSIKLLTYMRTYKCVCVCVCVCFRCVNAAIAVAASIFLALPLAHILYFGANSIMRRTMLIVEL